ncbi:MAG: TlpA family protein disulfide reductase [Bacteroidetes bacterium]|nr:TlpA family protein disulfide reductase [Bacteroidota bacterium]
MKTTVIKGLMLLVMGLAVLTAGGCLGGDKNFTSSASAAPAGQAAGATHPNVGTKIGDQAPDFTLKTLDGGTTIHLSDYRGKPVFVNFWASWCPPCKAEMPDIEQSYQKHKDEGYVFLGINNAEDPATVSNFVHQQNHYSWTFVLDPNTKAADAYYVDGIPASFFVDRNGIIRDTKVGEMSGPELESKLAKIK